MTSVNTPQHLLAEAVSVLCAMATRHGQYLSVRDAEHAWLQVTADSLPLRLRAAWRWLYPSADVIDVPYAQRHRAQLPAWVVVDERLGIVHELAETNAALMVTWGDGSITACTREPECLWVAFAQTLNAQEQASDKPATEAILTALKVHRPVFYRVALASTVINVLAIISSLFAMQVYDRVVPNFAYSTLWVLSSGVLLAIIFDVVFKWVRLKLLETSAQRLDDALSLYFFERLMALKLDRRPPRVGTLVAQFRDYEVVKSFFSSTTIFAISDLPFIAFFIIIIAVLGGYVALVPLCFVPICIAIGFMVRKPLALRQQLQSDESARRTGVLFEAIDGAETLKAQSGEWHFSVVWQVLTRKLGIWGHEIHEISAWTQFAAGALQQLAYVLVIAVGVYEIEFSHLTMGALIACSILGGRVLGTTLQIPALLVQWAHARHALGILDEVLALPSDDTAERTSSAQGVSKHLKVEGVSYAYESDQPAQLIVARLQIPLGDRVAIVGRNGSGKSTLIKLLAALAMPQTGQISLAGIDVQKARVSWLRESIGYLPQETRLFAGTLRDNLLMGLTPPDETTLQATLIKTGLDKFIATQAKGLDTPVRESGLGLSGGQRQLIGITRLFLQAPDIWLLDEPGANLDQESEANILQLLAALPLSNTLIFVTHRNNWLTIAQRILVLENGQLKADVPADSVRKTPSEAVVMTPAQSPTEIK